MKWISWSYEILDRQCLLLVASLLLHKLLIMCSHLRFLRRQSRRRLIVVPHHIDSGLFFPDVICLIHVILTLLVAREHPLRFLLTLILIDEVGVHPLYFRLSLLLLH